MKTKLITALRLAANAVENGSFAYKWSSYTTCNCGVVACAISGHSSVSLSAEVNSHFERLKEGERTWQNFVGMFCPLTGTPMVEILKKFYDVGMTASDIVQLENLSNPKVVERVGKFQAKVKRRRKGIFGWLFPKVLVQEEIDIQRDQKVCLINYLRAWADILEKEGREDMPQKETQTCMSHD